MTTTIEATIRSAMDMLSRGDVAQASTLLDDLKSKGDESWSVREVVGWHQARSFAASIAGRHSEASLLAEEAAKAQPDDASLWLGAASFAERAAEYERCAYLLNKARRTSTLGADADLSRMCDEMERRVRHQHKDDAT